MDKDFRFGLSMRFFRSRSALVEKVKRAEDLGYDILCVPDHLGAAAPFPTLTAVTMVTTRMADSLTTSCLFMTLPGIGWKRQPDGVV